MMEFGIILVEILRCNGVIAMRHSLLPLLIAGSLLSGCSIHPSPGDVMPLNTAAIVDRIKCETTFALTKEIVEKLRHNDLEGQDAVAASKLADAIDHDPGTLIGFKPTMLAGTKARDFYKRYINTAIAYDFTLTGMEDNSISAEVDFARVVTNGAVSVPFSASDDHMRQSVRTFTIAETFESLLTAKHLLECPRGAEEPNFNYPISGTIGIYDIIKTFIDLNEEKDLTLKKGAPNVYADALTFTTTTVAGAVPKLVLAPPTRAFHLTGATFNEGATRKDTDVVTIGLSVPVKGPATAQDTKDSAKGAIVDNRTIQFQNSLIQFFSTR